MVHLISGAIIDSCASVELAPRVHARHLRSAPSGGWRWGLRQWLGLIMSNSIVHGYINPIAIEVQWLKQIMESNIVVLAGSINI